MATIDPPAAPPPPGVISNFDNPQDVLRTVNLVAQYLSIAVVTIFVALRIFIKIHRFSRLNVEDFSTTADFFHQALFVGFCSCMALLSYHGGGYHAWDVRKAGYPDFLKITYVITLVYVPMAFAVKVALLSIVIRIFSPDRRKVIAIYVILGVLLAYYIPCLFMKIFACRPVSGYWLGVENGGWCFNQQKVIMADSVISMVSDFVILVLPLPLTWNLHISTAKKLKVIGILGAGGVATAFSVWRLVIMVQEGSSPDYTVVFVRCVLTGNAEAGLGLICACLPVLSSYHSSRVSTRNKSNPTSSAVRSYELSSWQKISGNASGTTTKLLSQRKNNRDFPHLLPDQAELICTTTTEIGEGESSASLRSHEKEQH
ncbi:hypothetical protein AJ79_04400 [Helicocarpus griseus UAMH5409]|uniref:Rhodopsin domain-containing protein n=1 Tax=Helicocarpus griseus UAMH5409 TaxID=1447875 RepID=A0A2B7XTB1_9EURO|nr:hypothetical protein AJ79_04400 [Helicocarpus griseus UAMH5409]